MEDKREQLYTEGLTSLKTGAPLPAVLAMFAKDDTELAEELTLASILLSIPKQQIPRPIKAFKFTEQPISFWNRVSWRSFVIAPLAVVLFATTAVGVHFTSKATAGQKLFVVKKAYEKTQLALTINPESKAQLQLELSQKRLQEAESVLYGPEKNPKLQAAALAELSAQAKTTAEAVKQSNANQDQNSDTVASLESISSELASLSKNADTTTASSSSNTAAKVENFKKILTAAKDTGITHLDPAPTVITVSGKVQNVQDNIIYIENYAWEVNEKTTFKLGTEKASLKEVNKTSTIKLTGEKKNEHFIATDVIITVAEKPTETPKAEPKEKIKPTPKIVPTSTPVSSNNEPMKVISRIIVEDPTPQYQP